MNVNVTIASPELAEALNNLADAIRGRTGAFVPVTEAETAPVPGKPARSARAKPTTPPTSEQEAGSDAGAKGTPEQEPASSSNDESSDAEGVDYADIKKAVVALSLAKGRDQVVAILTKFGVPEGGKADQVAEERWGELLLALTEAAK